MKLEKFPSLLHGIFVLPLIEIAVELVCFPNYIVNQCDDLVICLRSAERLGALLIILSHRKIRVNWPTNVVFKISQQRRLFNH
jgi:hypothetical protein